MENTVSVQTVEFLYSALLGVGILVFYDFLRTIRSYIKDSRAITSIFDALFWVCAVFALLVFVMTYTEGRMRWYVLFGAFCGGFVYRAAASEIVFKLMKTTVDAAIRLLRFASRPVYLLLSFFKRSAGRIERKVSRTVRNRKGKKKGKADKVGSKKEKKKEHFS